MVSGDTKINQYLDIAANGGRADLPSDNCCNTRTQSLIIGVAERIMDVEDEVEEMNTRLDGLTLLKITQTAYDQLQTKDPNTLYVITGA